jgi:anthranilate phosphoribosyltransferase
MASLKELLKPLAQDGAALTREQAAGVLEEILSGAVPEVETAALLAVLSTRGEQAPELAGFVDVMRRRVTPLPFTDAERDELVDAVGTGGGGPLTFNISCGAALVAAAAGAKVAKHGNRRGHLAVRRGRRARGSRRAHRTRPGTRRRVPPSDRLRVPLRAALSPGDEGSGAVTPRARLPDYFQFSWPADQPAGRAIRSSACSRRVGAAGGPHSGGSRGATGLRRPRDRRHRRADHHRRIIVARIEESESGESTLHAARVTPEMAGLPRATLEHFTGGDVATNKALLYDVLTGIPGARRDIVLLNAAATLVAAGLAADLKEGVRQGAEAIDSGQAAALLAKLREFGAKHAGAK